MRSYGIVTDIEDVLRIASRISDSVIGEPFLPDFQIRANFFFRAERKSAFDELNGSLQTCFWSHENVDVIRHDYKFVEQICGSTVVVESVDKKACPTLVAKVSATVPRRRCDHVGLAVICGVFAFGLHALPQRLKPRIF